MHCTIQFRSNQFVNWIEFVEQPTRKNLKIKLNNVTINTAFLISVGWHDDNFTVLNLGFRFVDRNNSVQIPPKKNQKDRANFRLASMWFLDVEFPSFF